MSILAVGINHTTAPVALREVVAFSPESTESALRRLLADTEVSEAAILSTCNRTELYCSLESGDPKVPADWLHRYHSLEAGRLQPFLYHHHEDQAVRHMLRVAAGLDSMVLGEPEVLGQLKTAYRLATSVNSLGPPLDRLFQHSFAVAKHIRSQTDIGRSPVSVAYTGVKLAQRVFADLSQLTVLLVGAGETIELTARHLLGKNIRHLLVANRTLSRATELATRFRGTAIGLDELADQLPKCDLIITSTGATEPVITHAALQRALKARRHKPIFIIDLAVPRDVDPRAAELADIYLYTLDDLQRVIDENHSSRQAAAAAAEAIVDARVEGFMAWRRSLDAADTIRDYRRQLDGFSEELLADARRRLEAGQPVDEVLSRLTRRLTRKALHQPTVRLRDAAAAGRRDLLEAARTLLVDAPDPAPDDDSGQDA